MDPDAAPSPHRLAMAAMLEWYAAAGVDAILLDVPRDRFRETADETGARGAARPQATAAASGVPALRADAAARAGLETPPPRAPSRPAGAPAPPAAPAEPGFSAQRIAVPDAVAIADARERARSASTLEELQAALEGFDGCNLRLTAKSLVFGNGDAKADLMLIGEAPGRDEDIAGEPFVGKSGQLLDRMLAAIGIERAAVRVTNTVPWRPPGNRPPTPTETQMCLPFLARHIELVAPKVLVCLGSPAAKAVLATDEGILRLRGRWQTYAFGLTPADQIPALPMLHPAYLLRQPAQKKLAWRDLMTLKAKLDENAPER